MKYLKIILTGTVIIISSLYLSACKKLSPPQCEEWEVKDEKHSIGNDFSDPSICFDLSCVGRHTYNLSFCGESLKDAKEGNTIVLDSTRCCKQTRTFIRKIG